MHIQAIGADAGLPGITKLRSECALNGSIQIGIFEHDKGRVAAKLQGDFLDVVSTFSHDLAPDLGGPREGNFAHDRVAGQLFGNLCSCARDHRQHSLGNARLFGEVHQRQRRERRLGGRLDDHGATGGQRRPCFAGNHCAGEIPRRNGGANTHGLFDDQQAFVRCARNNIAVDPLRLLRIPLDIGRAEDNFTQRFRQRLALLQGHDVSQIVLIFDNQVVPTS
ncbi:hypothetical protein D3C86_1568140 [compost metagenome]